MKYFISLRLSHNTVTVLQYRDDDGIERLQPFKGCDRPIPLAISIINDNITVGQTALGYYEQHLPNCFYKVFTLLDSNETYRRFNANHPAKTLIYVAIEAILENLLRDNFGDHLDSIRNSIPIGFDFEADVTPEERKKVIDLFRNGYPGECEKYGNIGIIDTNRLIAEAGLKDNFRKYAMVLDSNGSDISASLYSKGNAECLLSRVFPGLGTDPGIALGVKNLKDQILSYNPFIDFSPIEERLQDIITQFMSSNKTEIYGAITINGYNYDYFLANCDIKSTGSAHGQNVITDIRSLAYTAGGINLSDLVFMVRGENLQTEYFMKLFKGEMDCVKIVDEKLLQGIDEFIISDVIKSGWTLDENSKQKQALDEEYAELKQRIEIVLIPQNRFSLALEELKDFDKKTKTIDYHEHDEHINQFIKQIQELQNKSVEKPSTPIKPASTIQNPDTENWSELVEAAKEQVRNFVKNGMYGEARTELSNLKADLHDAGITEFDADISRMYALLDKKPISQKPEPPKYVSEPKPVSTKIKSASVSHYAEIVASKGFLGAKHWCSENDDFDGAVLMGKLDKLHKKYELALTCLENYVAEGNTVGIKRFFNDLTSYIELLKEAKLQTEEAEKLLKQYEYYL